MTGKADAVRAVSQQFKDRTNTVIEGVMAHLRDDNAKEILGPGLSPLIGRGSLKSIVTFALYADVLRMARDVLMADGMISDEEVQESLGLISVLASGFAKVRKEYASFTQLTPDTARQFLSQYESDAGLFGHANEATKWAGVNVCRNVEAKCGDSGPVNAFCGTLVSWAESVASADGMSPEEQQHLNAFRQMFASARDASHNPTPPNDAVPSNPENLLTATSIESDPHASKSHFTHIEDGAAALLADASYPLTLSSLVALSPYAAACLGKHVGGTLELNGLREISDGVAEGLSTRTKTLSLNGLVRLSDASAKHLSRCAAKLSLRGLTELPDTPGHLALATKLASQQGDLVLDGLERLGPKVAAKLSEHSGRLALRGLTRIDDEVLSALFSRSIQPELSADMLRTLFVRGSERFIAQYCIANGGDLGILQSLSPSECDLSAARAIVDAGIDLSFDEIHEIAPDIGSVLATSTHDIRIGHLATLSEESARALREHSGALIIGTVSEVSLGAAKALAEHCGPITVEDIDDLPEDVAAVLGQRSESGDSEQPLVERACELLSTVQGLATYDPADLRDVDFTLLATMAGELIQKLRDAEHVHRPAVESTCGVLERLQELADQDLADFDDVDLQQLANDAEAATRELNQGGSNESEDGVTEDKVLTRDEAERFVADPESVNLCEYASLKDDASAILASSREDLCLDGLKEISATAAQALIPHTGAVSLESLDNLTPSAAQFLSRHAGPLRELNLGAFVDEPLVFAALRKHVSLVAQVVQDDLMAQILRTKDIDKEDEYEFEFADASSRDLCDEEYYGNPMDDGLRLLAQAEGRPVWSVPLASVKDSWVCENAGAYTLYFIGERDDVLKRLETLPNHVATEEVVQHFLQQYESGDWDFLSSYGALDLEAAAALATDFPWGDGNELWLSGLQALPPEVAAALSQPQPQDSEEDKVPILVMSGLRQVTEQAAQALSGRKWALQLPNLKTLSPEVAGHLGKIPFLCVGVENLSAAAAACLTSVQELSVKTPRLEADVASSLSKNAGTLFIEVKEELSAESAMALGTRSGTLCLQGLPSLSEDVARGLASQQGKLDLCGFSNLTPEAARILCKHDGELEIVLESQPPAVAEILKQHPSLR